MTREERKQDTFGNEERKTMYSGHYEYADEVIDKIYDDFESRTCGSCKYSIYHKEQDILECSRNSQWCWSCNAEISMVEVVNDFGCNKWESK